jgi:hypothetical protein
MWTSASHAPAQSLQQVLHIIYHVTLQLVQGGHCLPALLPGDHLDIPLIGRSTGRGMEQSYATRGVYSSRKLYAHLSCPGIATRRVTVIPPAVCAHLLPRCCKQRRVYFVPQAIRAPLLPRRCDSVRSDSPSYAMSAYHSISARSTSSASSSYCLCLQPLNTRFRFPFPIAGNNMPTAGAGYRQRCESLVCKRCSSCPPEWPQG